MKNTTTTTTTTSRFDYALNGLSDEDLKNTLTNRVVTYFNNEESSVKNDGIRKFAITSIEKIDYAKESGRRYVQCEVQDLDDGGKFKSRTLHVAGIDKVTAQWKLKPRFPQWL